MKTKLPLILLTASIGIAGIGYELRFISTQQFEHSSASGATIETGTGEILTTETIPSETVQPVITQPVACINTTPAPVNTKVQLPLTNLPFDEKVETFFKNEFVEDISTVKQKLATEFPDPRQYASALSELKNLLRDE